MNSHKENMNGVQAFLSFRDKRCVFEGEKPSQLMPWVFADVTYEGDGLRPLYIKHATIEYNEEIWDIRLIVKELLNEFDFFAEFKTYYQHFQYDDNNDQLIITGEANNDDNKKYRVVLS